MDILRRSPTPPLKSGKRVFIRKPSPWDETEFIKKIVASKNFHYPYIVNKLHGSFFKQYLLRFEGKSEGHLVCSLANDEIIGVININDIVKGAFFNGYLGYYVFKQYAGQGFMSEGFKLVMDRAFTDMKLHRLEANTQPTNEASKNFLKRHGFTREGFSPRYLKVAGRWRDHERWALLKDDWLVLQTNNGF
ncbi:GNAT family N-acetyltransferase [bacterium]|nr:GNAT family N-acetyltransferase [bacterium]